MSSNQATQLVKLAGDRAFERGQDYYNQGRVTHLSISGDRVTASVEGTHLYRVHLRETLRGLEGYCDCPASERVDFCKHCVAVALAFEARKLERQQAATGSAEDRIRMLLDSQPHEALVQMIVEVLPDLPALLDRLTLQADFAASVLDTKGLKKILTKAMPMRDVWGYQKTARYFERAESAVAGVSAIADQIAPKMLLATVLHGIGRLNKALERVDDSGGYRWVTQYSLRELHVTALARLNWPPEKLAEHLLDLTLEDPWDQFSDVLTNYAELLGREGRDAFFAQAQARLDALPALPFGADTESGWPYLRLTYLLTEKAQADGDIEQLISLAKRTCTCARDCYRIAELYLQKPDLDKALAWISKADEAAEPRSRNYPLRVAVHIARSEWPAAVDAQNTVFESEPDLQAYELLMKLAHKAGSAEQVKAQATEYLRAQLTARRWRRETCAETLAAIARDEGDMPQAYELIAEHIFSEHSLLAAAKWFEDDYPRQACELLTRAIEGFIGHKKKSGYRTAVDLVIDSRTIFDRLGDGQFDRFVQALRQRHKPKRNFIALLKEVQ